MSRPVHIQDQVILEAARRVFLRHGYGASTKQVAREAGVSEGTVFKRFKDKGRLFLAAMDFEPGGSSWQEKLMQSAGSGGVRRRLEAAGRQILENLQSSLPCVLMVRSSGVILARNPRLGRGRLPGPIQKIRALADYFRAEIKLGRLTMRNPEMQAQVFLGTLTHYVIHEMLFGFRTASPAAYVRAVVDMMLRTALPGRPAHRGNRKVPRA